MIKIKAYANCDHTYIVWIADAPIDKCLGFALYRLPSNESAQQIVETFVGPETERNCLPEQAAPALFRRSRNSCGPQCPERGPLPGGGHVRRQF